MIVRRRGKRRKKRLSSFDTEQNELKERKLEGEGKECGGVICPSTLSVRWKEERPSGTKTDEYIQQQMQADAIGAIMMIEIEMRTTTMAMMMIMEWHGTSLFLCRNDSKRTRQKQAIAQIW